jgi:hypothetical protein
MVKLWEIKVSDKVEPEIQKKIKRLFRPSWSVSHYGPQKCLFCEELTTWTTNDKPVCPKCSVKYGFRSELWLLDPCEVCGKQGEWDTDNRNPPQHFLCYSHRDQWLHWEIPELKHIDSTKQPEKWQQAWDEGWTKFVACMKEQVAV